jgi:hypothetical protein
VIFAQVVVGGVPVGQPFVGGRRSIMGVRRPTVSLLQPTRREIRALTGDDDGITSQFAVARPGCGW